MNLIDSAKIREPKIRVSPPTWVFALFWITFIAIFYAFSQAKIENVFFRYLLMAVCGLAMFGVLRNQIRGDYLVTLQASREGLYFQTDNANQYYFVPWKNVGNIEKAMFPVNRRGLRVEITGDLVPSIITSKDIGNVRTDGHRTFIYTIPQLHDRDRLIEQIESLRTSSSQ